MGSVLEIVRLQALAQQMQGDIPAALDRLRRALALAAAEGYVRLFVGEGPPMAALLKEPAKGDAASGYVHRLLAALETTAADRTVEQPAGERTLDEPLSERELEVLRLLATDLSGPQVARQLMVSLSTVRTHTRTAGLFEACGATPGWAAIAVVPIFAWELCLAFWLIIRGFNPAANAAKPVSSATEELVKAV